MKPLPLTLRTYGFVIIIVNVLQDVQAMASSLRNQLDGTMEAAVKLLQVIAVSNQQ